MHSKKLLYFLRVGNLSCRHHEIDLVGDDASRESCSLRLGGQLACLVSVKGPDPVGGPF
jgi:hypothetical protein